MPTKIEWCKNPDGTQGETWSPVTGCSKISEGCQNCFAEKMALRLQAMGQKKYTEKSKNGMAYTYFRYDPSMFTTYLYRPDKETGKNHTYVIWRT